MLIGRLSVSCLRERFLWFLGCVYGVWAVLAGSSPGFGYIDRITTGSSPPMLHGLGLQQNP